MGKVPRNEQSKTVVLQCMEPGRDIIDRFYAWFPIPYIIRSAVIIVKSRRHSASMVPELRGVNQRRDQEAEEAWDLALEAGGLEGEWERGRICLVQNPCASHWHLRS